MRSLDDRIMTSLRERTGKWPQRRGKLKVIWEPRKDCQGRNVALGWFFLINFFLF